MKPIIGAFAVSSVLAGCAGLPDYEVRDAITVARVIKEVECELVEVAQDFPQLRADRWAASINLTLQVDDSVGVNPTIAYIQPPALSLGISGLAKSARSRIYVESLALQIASLREKRCDPLADSVQIYGNLGIRRAVELGLGSITPEATSQFAKDKAFGQTIQFTVTKNISSFGPTFTFTNFSGPGGLLAAERIDMNELVIGFAPGAPLPKPKRIAGKKATTVSVVPTGDAFYRANAVTNQLILRSLPAFRNLK